MLQHLSPEFWFTVIVQLVGLAFSAGVLVTVVKSHEKRLTKAEERQDATDVKLSDHTTRLTLIESTKARAHHG